jgi:hypothetical protein
MTFLKASEYFPGLLPNLDRTICGAGGKPLVGGVEGDGADPAEMPRHDRRQLPGSVPLWRGDLDWIASHDQGRG